MLHHATSCYNVGPPKDSVQSANITSIRFGFMRLRTIVFMGFINQIIPRRQHIETHLLLYRKKPVEWHRGPGWPRARSPGLRTVVGFHIPDVAQLDKKNCTYGPKYQL